ncbi:sialidase family protein [Novilysobacter arseniciresistens]|uniref:sialidase family protein n=1 Tax=Novilysobacter arseniciresistens TaxID=1385522 RepID=UPI00068A66F3|nr:sialidase family protein [Lysobacter arseniciresistens]
MHTRSIPVFVLAAALAACQPTAPDGAAGSAVADAGDAADAAAEAASSPGAAPAAVTVAPWALPATGHAAQPDLVATPGGDLLLSWVRPDGEGHALVFARWDGDGWGEPRTVARGDDWFVNWADTPHLVATADGALWAHWLQKSAAATYAYDVALVRSDDGGASWSAPVLVNDDGTPTEHGFVSLWPAGDDRIGVAWLDGRETAGGGHEGHAPAAPADTPATAHDGHAAGAGAGADAAETPPAMTLRTAVFDAALARSGETRLDAMTCDCCQTDAAVTARGPLLVYRDRSPDEIRDIAATRFEGGNWSAAEPVHADGWNMPACPVNGPAVAADGEAVVVGWYTAAGGTPALKLARSGDAGDRFAAPVTVDSGAAVQGRVDVVLDDDSAWVLWTREDASGQTLQLARFAPDLSREWQRVELAALQGRGRGTGFAQLARGADGRLHAVWTDIVDGAPRLQGAVVQAGG